MKEEREWAVEAGNAERVEASEAERAREVPRRAFNTMSSGEGMSKAKGPAGPSGMLGALAVGDLCLDEAFGLAVESSSGDFELVRLCARRRSRGTLSRRSFRCPLSSSVVRGTPSNKMEAKVEGDARERLPSGLNIACTGTGR